MFPEGFFTFFTQHQIACSRESDVSGITFECIIVRSVDWVNHFELNAFAVLYSNPVTAP